MYSSWVKYKKTVADMNLPAGGVDNILFLTDSYKVTHHLQYPGNTTVVYSYFESRGGKFSEVVFFGLQYILKRCFVDKRITHEMIDEAKEVYEKHFGADHFNEEGWRYIVKEHDGLLPIRVKAVPEGTVVPVKNVLFTVENTDPKCFWLTNYFETVFVQTWYPMTVATNSREQKKILAEYLDETADSIDGLPFKLHDFGYRGASSVETAGIGGAAHLVNFQGTDTIAALLTARKYYHCDMAGYSIPAAEHSTITTWTKDGEKEAFRNMLKTFPSGLVAVVSDSYDIHKACNNYWGKDLKSLVENRNGTLVVRPDSGDPATVVEQVLDILGKRFGSTKNSKGYKMLPSFLRVIQGDGISYETLGDILAHIKNKGWSTDNIAFGSGGALLQKLDRDTQKCAFKCSHAIVGGKGVSVYKQPVTDPGKTSKKGRLSLHVNKDGQYITKQQGSGSEEDYVPKAKVRRLDDLTTNSSTSVASPNNKSLEEECISQDLLVTVFENGKLKRDYTFAEIRERAEIPLVKKLKGITAGSTGDTDAARERNDAFEESIEKTEKMSS